MAEDEAVNGAQIVAKILKELDVSAQERLMASISAKRPDLAAKVETEMFNFERVAALNDAAMQKLIREVPYRDIVVALKNVDGPTRERIMSNMSEAKQRIVSDDVRELPTMKQADVQAAQKRILRKLDEMYPEEEAPSTRLLPIKIRSA